MECRLRLSDAYVNILMSGLGHKKSLQQATSSSNPKGGLSLQQKRAIDLGEGESDDLDDTKIYGSSSGSGSEREWRAQPQQLDNELSDDDIILETTVPDRLNMRKRSETVASHPANDPPVFASFQSLGISAALIASLNAMSIRSPTPVQAACIPHLLNGLCVFATCGIHMLKHT